MAVSVSVILSSSPGLPAGLTIHEGRRDIRRHASHIAGRVGERHNHTMNV